jgi:hypothetical protein
VIGLGVATLLNFDLLLGAAAIASGVRMIEFEAAVLRRHTKLVGLAQVM